MTPVGLARARQLAETASALFPSLKKECERNAVRWEWASSAFYSLDPAYFEVHRTAPGKRIDEDDPATSVSGAVEYGFDSNDKLVIERHRTQLEGQYYETLYRWEAGGVARIHFGYDPAKPWINAAWLTCDDAGRVHAIDTVYARGNSISEFYRYDGVGRVVGLERRDADTVIDFKDFEYDATGNIARVYSRLPDGRRVLDFEKVEAERTFAARRQALQAGLANAIVSSLARVSVTEPVFALAIHYCGAEFEYRLPPNVSVGLESERVEFVASHGEDAPRLIWNPAEWSTQVLVELNAELASFCASANQDIWQNDLQGEADDFVADLARQVGGMELPIAKTRDFVTYAVNLDGDTFAEDVSAQVSPQMAQQLRRRGLL